MQPGIHEITINGITPTADESSIKVEGTGAATITDMTIDLVENSEHFEDVYPSESEDTSSSESESSSESDGETETVRDLTSQIRKLNMVLRAGVEERNSAQARVTMLDNYARSLITSRPDNIEACVEAYKTQRAKAFEGHQHGESKLEEHEEEVKRLKIQRRKVLQKEKEKKHKEKERKRKEKKANSKDERAKEREKQKKTDERSRLRQERIRFWPRKVFKVVLSLDANSGMTPTSSRRGSIDSLQKTPVSSQARKETMPDDKTADIGKIDILISYITYSASWSPRYDLALDTISKSGSITYRAELRNQTSETWRDAKVILSTSQTSFQGLGEPIPNIQPWNIRLGKGFGGNDIDNALFSRGEQDYKGRSGGLFGQKAQPHRSHLFGKSNPPPATNPFGGSFGGKNNGSSGTSLFSRPPETGFGGAAGGNIFGSGGGALFANRNPPSALSAPSNRFGASHIVSGGTSLFGPPADAASSSAAGGNLFGSNVGGLFGSSNNTQQSQQQMTGSSVLQAVGTTLSQPNIAVPQSPQRHAVDADELQHDIDNDTIAPDSAALAFEESTWEEAGLTETYTVPGSKTIAPSNTTRRQKIASIPLSSIVLSHVIVPKLRTAAFLKARLRNTSASTLLKGPVGLTLDGSFLGNTTLPRSSPGEAFVLNLGVDPALNVVYSKPIVRRSQSGVFQKEDCRIYTRSCTLTNTKNKVAVEATVTDQVPVSQDDKLKVDVLVPRGLRKGDDQAVKAGVGQINEGTGKKGSTYAENSARDEKAKWGKATAKMKKDGQIEWDVKLNPGQGVKLELEYETRFPGGESVIVA